MRGRALLALVLPLAVSACGGGGSSSMHPANDGVLWLSWTVKGAAVSDTACTGIDHLFLTMDTAAGELTIEPIPCLRGLGWEYDGMPVGQNVVVLDALDANGTVTLEGAVEDDVTATKPMMPVPVDLEPR
jgi:hypothetical protein